jgi:two-component sensor histidine kinase
VELSRKLRRSLPCSTSAPYFARRSIEVLEPELTEDAFDTLSLLVTELVTNSVCHSKMSSRDFIQICIDVEPTLVRAEVSDEGQPFHYQSPPPGDQSLAGRGLVLVDRLSDRWGTRSRPQNTVWFELDYKAYAHASRGAGAGRSKQ